MKPFNETLKSICDENCLQFIDNYDKFLLASGEMPESYFHSDKVHLNVAGTKKLFSNIDAVHRVTKTATHTANRMSARGFRQSRGHLRPRGYGTMPRTGSVNKYCYICARSGHDTQECWFNARSTPMGAIGHW